MPKTREASHKPQSPLQAIREKCRDCSCYQLNEIRACEAVNCAIWRFRAGARCPARGQSLHRQAGKTLWSLRGGQSARHHLHCKASVAPADSGVNSDRAWFSVLGAQ